MTGIEAMMAIREEFPVARIIFLSAYDWEEDIRRALQTGAKT